MAKLKSQFLKKREGTKLSNFRCTEEELQEIQKNADTYTGGNVSAWMRFSSIHFKPGKRFLEK